MFEQILSGSLLFQLAIFLLWSGILSALAFVIGKIFPKIIQWSRFWQAWLVIALLPLLPIYFKHTNAIIPEQLKRAFAGSQQSLLQHSNSMVSQMESNGEVQTIISLVLLILGLGVCFSLVRFCLGLIKVKQFVNKATVITDLNDFSFSEDQQKIIATNHIKVLVTERSVSPFVFGFFRVNLLLPNSVFTMPAAQQSILIDHELMHVKRQDPKAVILFRFCSSLFWFNPFISYMEKRFLQSMELNCDSAVIAVDPEKKITYARALITSLKLNKSTFDSGLTSYFSGPSFNKKDFENRIKLAMSKHPVKRFGWTARLVLISLSFFITFVAMAAKPFFLLYNFDQLSVDGLIPVLNGKISSGYDDVSDFRGNRPHQAIDFAAPIGTSVIASFSGWVIIADDVTLHQNYGKVILIEHSGQTQSLYAHLNSFAVEAGQYISAGDAIGTVGATGRVTGPHLHFEVLDNGKHADPKNYLDLSSLINPPSAENSTGIL